MKRDRVVTILAWSLALLACQGPADMSPPAQHIALAKAYVAAWNGRDVSALDTLLTPDAVFEDRALGVRAVGLPQNRDLLNAAFKEQPDLRWDVLVVAVSDSIVALEWDWASTFTGTCPSGPVVGKPIATRGASIVVIRNHRIARWADYDAGASIFCGPPAVPAGR